MTVSDADPALARLAGALERTGANLTLRVPGREPFCIGRRPERACVHFRSEAALGPLLRRDLLGLSEAYLDGAIDVDGDFAEVVKVTDVIAPDPSHLERLFRAARLLLPGGRRLRRASVAFHYDRAAEFFLPWFERWRSYSHGFYETPHDDPSVAQERKLQFALDALGVKPGAEVFDMGCGWASFLEYAGRQGVRVHGITLSAEQHRFVTDLIRARELPCSVELVDFADYRPRRTFDGAVFMGTLEHFPRYRRAAAFLAEHLGEGARVYADFCTSADGLPAGAFLARHVFPAPATYVDVPKLLRALAGAGFAPIVLEDDTRSYALTVRDWADAFDRERAGLAAEFGEAAVRAFQVFLRASEHFLATGRTRAYHLVAGRRTSPAATAPRQSSPNRSPTRP